MRLRWGILGTGNIAKQFANGVQTSTRGTLAAVASRSTGTAGRFARQFNVERPYGDYAAMLDDAAVDAVYVSLPNTMHHEWTIKALAAGKHVLCEKPLAVSAAEAEAMFAAAKKHGRVLVEAFMYRCHPQTIAVFDAVRRGVIGTPRLVRTSFCFRTTKIAGNIRFDPTLAGGALWDVGCYCTSFSRLIAGEEPSDVRAVVVRDHGVDVNVVGGMTFPGGLQASFVCAMNAQSDNAALICGDDGWLRITVPWKPMAATSGYTIERQTPPKQDTIAGSRPPVERVDVPVDGDVYALEADAFADVVDGRIAPFVTEADSLGNLRILERLHAGHS